MTKHIPALFITLFVTAIAFSLFVGSFDTPINYRTEFGNYLSAFPQACSVDKYEYHVELITGEDGVGPEALAAYLTDMHNTQGYELVTILIVQGFPFAHFRRPLGYNAPEPTPTMEAGDA